MDADDHASWGPSPWLLAIAAGLVAGGLAWWWTSTSAPEAVLADAASSASAPLAAGFAASGASAGTRSAATASSPTPGPAATTPATTAIAIATPSPRIPRHRDPNGDQTPDLADYVNEGETPTMSDVIDRLHQAGIHTGLGAFNPPGTRPPLVGLAVPDDFVLPEGYVRHYQATDDGQRIEPILMFSPDHPVLDADHRPIAVPANRVVPPELAPPGLPIRRIVVPAPADTSGPGR